MMTSEIRRKQCGEIGRVMSWMGGRVSGCGCSAMLVAYVLILHISCSAGRPIPTTGCASQVCNNITQYCDVVVDQCAWCADICPSKQMLCQSRCRPYAEMLSRTTVTSMVIWTSAPVTVTGRSTQIVTETALQSTPTGLVSTSSGLQLEPVSTKDKYIIITVVFAIISVVLVLVIVYLCRRNRSGQDYHSVATVTAQNGLNSAKSPQGTANTLEESTVSFLVCHSDATRPEDGTEPDYYPTTSSCASKIKIPNPSNTNAAE